MPAPAVLGGALPGMGQTRIVQRQFPNRLLELLMKFEVIIMGRSFRLAVGIIASIILSVLLPVGVGLGSMLSKY